MKLSTFSSAIKEIVLTSLAAMLLFSLAAAQSARASDAMIESKMDIPSSIQWVTQTESDYVKKLKMLAAIEEHFNKGEATLSDLFKAQVEFN